MDTKKLQTMEPLKALAEKYIWWQTPDEAMQRPQRVIAQIMNIGDFDDTQALAALVGDEVMRDTLAQAEAGQFNPRSWYYWHYRLDLAEAGKVPPMPKRNIP